MSDTPISEDDLARMFDDEDAGIEPEPEPEPEPEELDEPAPTIVADEPQIVTEPAEPASEAEPDAAVAEEEAPQGEPHLEWARRRNLTTFEDAAKLAYEQERFLGRKSSDAKEATDRIAALEAELATVAAQAPTQGRSEEWINQAVVSPDPARYAWELASSGDWQSYERMMETWETVVGETITVGVHNQIMAQLQQGAPQAEPEPGGNQEAIREAFALNGVYDMVSDPIMPTVRIVADELGGASPLVQGAAQGDPVAVQGLVEIARARSLTTRTLRITDPNVERPELAGEGQSPSRTPPKKDPFADMEDEWRRMGVLPVSE